MFFAFMVVDGWYYWHCDVCGESVAESPLENDPMGYGNLLLIDVNGQVKQVCRSCVEEMGEAARGKGIGFIYEGASYRGPLAREWVNEVINGLLDDDNIDEWGCGYPIMMMLHGAEVKPGAQSLVSLVQSAQRCCIGCNMNEPDDCPVRYWSEKLGVPLPAAACGTRKTRREAKSDDGV